MSFSFSSLVRLIVIMALGTTMLAIGLSRLDPARPGWRTRVAARYSNLNEFFMNYMERQPRWLDAETGRVVCSPLDDGDVMEAASCSPWVNEKGEYQVAGRWSSRTKMGPMSVSTDFGLARYSFPSGQLLDHVSTEIVPVGPPAWFPGTRARILFTGGDGQLYHYAFEAEPSEKSLDKNLKRDSRPIPLTWRCPKPGLGNVFLSDLSWPQDSRMIGYVLVAIREQSPASETTRAYTGTSLWWLKLDNAGTEIVEAGRLVLMDDSKLDSSIDLRSPSVGRLPDGKLALAYLTESKNKPVWQLRIAPIEFEGDHDLPKVRVSTSVLLSTNCQPAHPSFSADGRWLNAIAESTEPNGRILRLSLTKYFPTTK